MTATPASRLTVCHIAEATAGGVGRQLELAAQALPARGIDLQYIVSTRRDPAFAATVDRFRNAGHTVEVVPMIRSLRPWKDWLDLQRIRRALRRLRPAVVHTHASKAGYLGRKAACGMGIPVVHTPHVYSFEWCTHGLRSLLFRCLERRAAWWADRIVLLSDLQLERAFTAGIGPAERLVVIPNGVDAADFRPEADAAARSDARARFGLAHDGPVVGLAGRLEPQKGMGRFLHAAKAVLDRLPEVRFLIAGDGSLRPTLEARASTMGIRESLVFCGHVEHMRPFYAAVDIFVLASLWEGMPYVILEAQACGRPVVATRTCGAEALIEEEETGLLADVGDAKALATQMSRVLETPALAEHLGAWGRARVEEHFTLSAWADRLVALYREVAGAPSFSTGG